MLPLASAWVILSFSIVIMYLLSVSVSCVPQIFKELFYYGKVKTKLKLSGTSYSFSSAVERIQILKRSFLYFYFLGFIVNFLATLMCLYCYENQRPFPSLVEYILKLSLGINFYTQTNAFSTVLICFLMTIQTCRRYLECLYTSIYSQSTINILHFMLGAFLYTSFPLATLTQAKPPELHDSSLFMQINHQHIIGMVIFMIGSLCQHETHKMLAELRQDKLTGKVKDLDHHIPRGWMFEWISCPHYLSEIVIYFSFCFIDGFISEILNQIFVFVICNQLISGHMSHIWYKKNFKDYPKDRKAVIPLIF